MDYGIKKLFSLFLTAIVPLLVCVALIYLNFPVIGILFFPLLLGIVIAFVCNIITSNNPFIKAIEGKAILAFDFNSSGIARVFNVIVSVPDIHIKTREGHEKRLYDRMISLVLHEPENATLEQKGEKIEFKMPKEEYQKSVFRSGSLNFMIFNSQTGMFLTKEFLASMEKTLMIEYVTLNEWREIKELSKIMRDFSRKTIDTVLHKTSGMLLGNPIVKIIAVILVVLVIGAIILQAAPMFGVDLIPKNINIFGAVSNTVKTPITDKASNVVVGLMKWF